MDQTKKTTPSELLAAMALIAIALALAAYGINRIADALEDANQTAGEANRGS